MTNIPVRSAKTKETVYPLQFNGAHAASPVTFLMIWGCELNLAVRLGLHKLEVGRRISYEKGTTEFREYIKFFF